MTDQNTDCIYQQSERKRENMASIRDVARKAGVAISTVSKVLNNYPSISEETRVKVNQAITELNFTPNSIAAALSSKKAGRVALLMNLITHTQVVDEINMQYLHGAINTAQKKGLDVITVFFPMLQEKNVSEIISYFHAQSIEGIIIFGMNKADEVLQQLIASQVFKIVVIDAPFVNEDTSCVQIDHEQAQYDVVKKTLHENPGSSKVMYLTGKENGYVTELRLKGLRRLAEEEQLSLKILDGEFSEKKAREFTMQYAGEQDIVACASDLMAIGAMRALQEMDIFKPVCGFDGITLMGYAGKQMNTVKQDFYHISSEAVEEMDQLLTGNPGKEIILKHELVRMQYLDIIC